MTEQSTYCKQNTFTEAEKPALKAEELQKRKEHFGVMLKTVTDLYMEIEPCETITDKEMSLEERIILAEELLWQYVESILNSATEEAEKAGKIAEWYNGKPYEPDIMIYSHLTHKGKGSYYCPDCGNIQVSEIAPECKQCKNQYELNLDDFNLLKQLESKMCDELGVNQYETVTIKYPGGFKVWRVYKKREYHDFWGQNDYKNAVEVIKERNSTLSADPIEAEKECILNAILKHIEEVR